MYRKGKHENMFYQLIFILILLIRSMPARYKRVSKQVIIYVYTSTYQGNNCLTFPYGKFLNHDIYASSHQQQGWFQMPFFNTWWRHQMLTFSALLALCTGNSPVTGEFSSQRPVTRSFDVFFDLRLNKRFSVIVITIVVIAIIIIITNGEYSISKQISTFLKSIISRVFLSSGNDWDKDMHK